MKATIYRADGGQEEVEPIDGKSFNMRELQSIVGGTFDIQRLPKSKKWIVVNDDGKLIGLPRNAKASEIWQENYPIEKYPHNNDGLVVGDVLVCGLRMIK